MDTGWAYHSASPEETLALGAAIASALSGGMVVALTGPLGAGKTLLTKGIAAGNAGRSCEVTSPTFTLVQEYAGRLGLYHLDVYRLASQKDPLLMALAEMVRADSVAIVEWADRVQSSLDYDILWITIAPLEESARSFSFRASGPLSSACLERLQRSPIDTRMTRS